MQRVLRLLLLGVVVSARFAQAAPVRRFEGRAATAGTFDLARDGVSRMERLSFDAALPGFLEEIPMESEVSIAGWPLSPGRRAEVSLTRHDVYAADARIFRVDGGTLTELPKSRLHFFWGTVAGDEATRVVVILDPDRKTFHGLAETEAGLQELRAETGDEGARHVLGEAQSFLSPEQQAERRWSCGEDQVPYDPAVDAAPRQTLAGVAPLAITSLHTAVIAVDTDNELMAFYGDNTTNATNYIASLFASMSLMYERDLLVRLVQGTTFLRVTTTPDPYALGTNGGAGIANLNEFTNYWATNNGGITRALAMMLSGKQSSGFSASGIAWLDGLCNSSSTGYSYSQVFKPGNLTGDTYVVGHEVGHNFGSPHTHCYNPPIDTCYIQSGPTCWPGPGTSCPAAATYNGVPSVTGTLMSYCHVSGIAGCSAKNVFHPTSVALLQPKIVAAVGTCIFPFTVAAAGPIKFYSVPPCRVVDTRNAAGSLGGPALAANGLRVFPIVGSCGVPASAKSISGNITVTQVAAAGDLKIYPADLGPPSSTSITFAPGLTRANSAQLRLATNSAGTLAVQNESASTIHFILDVNGYFQ
ncbi:MAG: M12 family metallo-peptidase [Thermoanaerobaculia bacterium]